MKIDITIFTPTYNRADTLKKLYNSLVRQTVNSFEWIIVDDGSTDNTKEVIEEIKVSNDFPIKYFYQVNGGKHKAINRGLEVANGELFFIVDSDDFITETSLERIIFWKNTIVNVKNFAGLGGLKGYSKGELIGSTFKNKTFLDATSLERENYGILGDKAEVFFTKVLKKYKFPEFDGENFVSESVVWNKLANDGLKIRWFNEIIYITEYRNDGLTSMGLKKFLLNWEGYSLYINQELKFRKRLLKRLSIILIYAKLSKYKGQKISISSKKIECNLWIFVVAYFMSDLYCRVRKLVF